LRPRNFYRCKTKKMLTFLLLWLPGTGLAAQSVLVHGFRGSADQQELKMQLANGVRTGAKSAAVGQQLQGETVQVLTLQRQNALIEEKREQASSWEQLALSCIRKECEEALSKALGVDYYISGQLSLDGDVHMLSLELYQVDPPKMLKRMEATGSSEVALKTSAKEQGEKLLSEGFGFSQEGFIVDDSSTGWSAKGGGVEVAVSFVSIPEGASVSIGGKSICSQTPCKKYISEGKHEAVFHLEGYGDLHRAFMAETSAVVEQDMNALMGVVTVETTPSGVEIHANDRVWGVSPLESMPVQPGDYKIMAKSDCYQTLGYQLQLKAQEERQITLPLESRKSGLKVYAYDGDDAVDGDVFVDGVKMGRTAQNIEVPLCSQEVELHTDDGKSWSGAPDLIENSVSVLEAKIGRESEISSRYPMNLISEGKFLMGSEEGANDERPVHVVRIYRPFYIGTAEVTQALYEEVMGTNPSHFQGCGGQCPAENMSWLDAVRFANAMSRLEGREECYQLGEGGVDWLGFDCMGYRLPTEAEWEFAAKAGEEHKYSGSDNLDEVGWYMENSGRTTKPVGQLKANDWGLYDMSGNVWEFVWDWYDKHGYADRAGVTDPIGPEAGTRHVYRGGCWKLGEFGSRVSYRYGITPNEHHYFVGIRLARSAN
jgi:formylglycine-generating enzyme